MVNQHEHENKWKKLGTYLLGPGARIELTNYTGEAVYTRNVAFDSIAFVFRSPASCTPAPGPDADGDHLPDAVETSAGLLPNDSDTDDDGLPDAWEADPSMAGSGIYLPGRPCKVATRDELFGPYGTRSAATEIGELVGPDTRFNRPPNPRHKDVYLELDWQSCNSDNSGCPIVTPGFGSVSIDRWIDPAFHLPPRAALDDVVKAFAQTTQLSNPDGRNGVNLNIIVDEKTDHRPTCDKAPSDNRGRGFGSAQQRQNIELMTAKSRAFRYVWSGHSTAEVTDAQCPAPSAQDLLFHNPLPSYDYTPYGSTNMPGNDILLSLSLGWWCPSDLRIVTPETLLPLLGPVIVPATGLIPRFPTGSANPCVRSFGPWGTPESPGPGDGLYPWALFTVKNGATTTNPSVSWPMAKLLGVPEADGSRQLFGRSLMRLLGLAMGIPAATVKNDPLEYTGPGQPKRAEEYGSWVGAKLAPIDTAPGPVTQSQAEVKLPGNVSAQQADRDGDGKIERDDNCPGVVNVNQANGDEDVIGDACDPDADGLYDQLAADGWGNTSIGVDPFPADADNDGTWDLPDPDDDNDGDLDPQDNCRMVPNADQSNFDGDAFGDACDPDDDNDGWGDDVEVQFKSDTRNATRGPEALPAAASGQVPRCADGIDNDADGVVDAADNGCTDADGDTMPDVADPCPNLPDFGWRDRDRNGVGDSCEGVRIVRAVAPGVAAYDLAGVARITWRTALNGTVTVRLHGSTCTDGTVVATVVARATLDEDHNDGQFITITTELPVASLRQGANRVRVCLDAGDGVVRSDAVTLQRDGTGVVDPAGSFHSIQPFRVLHTGEGIGLSGAIGAGQTKSVTVAGMGGVPAVGATSVLVNITVAGATATSHLSVWPSGTAQPNASTINFSAGQVIANANVARLGADGKLSIYNNSGSVQVIVDVVGWYDTGTEPMPQLLKTLPAPARLLDSRDGTGGHTTAWGPGQTRDVTVAGVGGIPIGADSVVLTLTVTAPTAVSHLSVWPSGSPQPTTSVMNFPSGATLAAHVVARVGANGKISVRNNSGNVQVIADAVGYYSADFTGRWLRAATPTRVLDSRDGTGGFSTPWPQATSRVVPIAGRLGIPVGVKAVVVNLTVIGGTATSHLTVWQAGVPRPGASNINFPAGAVLANLTITALNDAGAIEIYNNSGSVHVVADVVGWFV